MNILPEDFNKLADSPEGEVFANELVKLMNEHKKANIVTRVHKLKKIIYDQKGETE